MSDFRNYLDTQLDNPEFARAYEELTAEYDVAKAVMQARIDEGLTQQQLAERTGMNASNISRLETGGSLPTLRTLKQLAKGMGKNLEISLV